MQNIFENVTIVYKNGSREIYDAISISKKGIYTGKIKTINENSEEFTNHGFIPTDQIQKIMIFNENGKLKDIEIK